MTTENSNNNMPPFHLAIPVDDLSATERFYVRELGCRVGRRSDSWIDFDFFGHQVSAHLKPEETRKVAGNPVDGVQVPVRHFGVVLDWQVWHEFSGRLKHAGTVFLIEPTIRFEGQPGEQATLFIRDPSGNALEFKSFKSPRQLFATA
ncbi:MAG: VOC family protein [Thiotrichales bacterium]|nr:VOC family protein [Thiotrichales bacterium]